MATRRAADVPLVLSSQCHPDPLYAPYLAHNYHHPCHRLRGPREVSCRAPLLSNLYCLIEVSFTPLTSAVGVNRGAALDQWSGTIQGKNMHKDKDRNMRGCISLAAGQRAGAARANSVPNLLTRPHT